MCNIVYLSTDSPDDLTAHNHDLIRFDKHYDHPADERVLPLLTLPYRWYVGSKSECSCTFRHWLTVNGSPSFGAPEDWYPEDEDEIEATKMLYRIIERLLSAGHSVECIDSWDGEDLDAIQDLDVCLGDVPIDAFRLFEGHRFRFTLHRTP